MLAASGVKIFVNDILSASMDKAIFLNSNLIEVSRVLTNPSKDLCDLDF